MNEDTHKPNLEVINNVCLKTECQSRSGFVALVGRPNVGKSSLLNQLLGQKIAIVSPKVQTTRTKILGVYNFPETEKNGQIVFIDLPGLHKPVDKLGESCLKISFDGAKESDLIIFMSEALGPPGKGDKWIAEWLINNCNQIPHLIVLNKKDLANNSEKLDRDLKAYNKLFSSLANPPKLLVISAYKGDGLKELTDAVWQHLPTGPNYFPDEMLTNRSVRFLAAELIREQILLCTKEEVPHSTAVTIESFEESKLKDQKPLTKIKSLVLTETESQKGIIIGKKGILLREIGSKARKQIENMLGHQVYLELKVKVLKKWRENQKELNRLGYSAD